MGVLLYCGIGETTWNRHPVAPGSHICISPVYGKAKRRTTRVFVPDEVTDVIQDSGAFSDNWAAGKRLTFEQALERQHDHARRFGYESRVTHRASYDVLIDEVWTETTRTKRRWDEDEAERAVEETVASAEYAVANRDGANLILSAQGVTPSQYLRCVKQVVPLGDWQRDILGLGGWCIIGKHEKTMLPVWRSTLYSVIPYVAQHGVKRVHVWGVIHAQSLGEFLWMCDQHGLQCSTDSTGPQLRPAMFGTWGYADWIDRSYQKPPVSIRGLERKRHVIAVRDWLNNLRATQYYQKPPLPFATEQETRRLFVVPETVTPAIAQPPKLALVSKRKQKAIDAAKPLEVLPLFAYAQVAA